MAGATNLDHLLASMEPVLQDGVFVFAAIVDENISSNLNPVMSFREAEGTTLIIRQDAAEDAGIPYEFPCRMITLNIHSSLDAVGFLAVITARLATLGIGVNPVSAFYHDHLFIPHESVDDVMEQLRGLAAEYAAKEE